ncbi:serine/arginine repetitive matrix protein 1-like [Phymastichus coffea]|uniref:serine/arginine repetitive matrix protein 1-like n=1 Tax=Phymastichus coffea TaxID=108790 RepID=UPI00273C33AF|nr:serine/arginine repetitive matrix protein 1-like [Phymastichus coffea]
MSWVVTQRQLHLVFLRSRRQLHSTPAACHYILERLERCKLACKKLWMTSLDNVFSPSKPLSPKIIPVESNFKRLDKRSHIYSSTGYLLAVQMPRSRRRHRSRSHSRSHTPASPQYDHKRRRVDYDSPQSKGTYSGERVLRSRQHERGTSQERRYKRSHRRSPSSSRQHHNTTSFHAVVRERERERDRQEAATAATSAALAANHSTHPPMSTATDKTASSTTSSSSSKRNKAHRHRSTATPPPSNHERHRHRSHSKSQSPRAHAASIGVLPLQCKYWQELAAFT